MEKNNSKEKIRFSVSVSEELNKRVEKYQQSQKINSKRETVAKLLELALNALEKPQEGLSIREILATMHTELKFNQMLIQENNLMARVLNHEELIELSKKDEIKFNDDAKEKFENWKKQLAQVAEDTFDGKLKKDSKDSEEEK